MLKVTRTRVPVPSLPSIYGKVLLNIIHSSGIMKVFQWIFFVWSIAFVSFFSCRVKFNVGFFNHLWHRLVKPTTKPKRTSSFLRFGSRYRYRFVLNCTKLLFFFSFLKAKLIVKRHRTRIANLELEGGRGQENRIFSVSTPSPSSSLFHARPPLKQLKKQLRKYRKTTWSEMMHCASSLI